MWRTFTIVALCAGCASQPRSPFFGDEQYLRFGVDPRAEADELIKAYAQQAEPLALRLVGQNFTALGFMERSGRATRARVVTLRGIALALDPQTESPLQAAVRYALLAPPLPDSHDADGDGFEEVFVEERTSTGSCVRVYKVRDVGFVDQVPTQLRAFDRDYCVTGVDDLDHDGKAELSVRIELVDLDLPHPPTIRLLLWPDDQHGYSPRGSGQQLANFVAAQQAAREIELDQAKSSHDASTALRLAVELAALTQALGLPSRDQLARFDSALRDVRLGATEQAAAEAARAQIEQRWKAMPTLVSPTDQTQDRDAGTTTSGLAERDSS